MDSTSNEKAAAAALKEFLARLFALMATELEMRAEQLRDAQAKAKR